MKRSALLWLLAFVITAASAVYQRLTGPTHPMRGKAEIGGSELPYRLLRSHGGETDAPVRIEAPDPAIQGTLEWKRHKTADAWTPVPMQRSEGALEATLPHQPPAGKLNYRILLRKGEAQTTLPAGGPVVIRFKGDVPTWVLVVHVIAMFGGMMLANRAGLGALVREKNLLGLTLWTVVFLAVGGLILGPVVQKYAFGAYWTGWPFGQDLTDNKTAVALAVWVAAWIAQKRGKSGRGWVLAATVVTLAVYLIPHSVLGSELDYTKVTPPSPAS